MIAPNNWQILLIKDIGKVVTGRTPPTIVSDYFGDDYPFITPSDMKGDKIISSPERGLSSQGAALLVNNYLPPKSIAVSCIGWQMGKVAKITRSSFTNQQINTIIPHTDVEPDFIYYSLCTRREELKALGSVGTRTPILIKSTFENIQIPIPPLPIQRKIAAILSAYDDLIENNTRRIAILEEMAQSLYREWLVHFRFPGHEKNGMVKSALGLIPEGWEVVKLGDVSSFISRGISPRYDNTSESLVINQRCIRDGKLSMEQSRRHLTKVSNEKLVRFGDVLVNSTGIGTLGRVAQIYQDIPNCTVDSHVTIVRPGDKVVIDYFGFYVLGLQSYFDSLGVGSTGQTELNRESIANTSLVLPPKELQEAFATLVYSMRRNIILMLAKNANLRKTRDLLLPKLISGEVDAERLEIAGVDETGEVETKAIEV